MTNNSEEKEFTFWIVRLSRVVFDSNDPNKREYVKTQYYEKPALVDTPERAKHFRTLKNAEKIAAAYRSIGYKTGILEYRAQLQNGEN
jgi:hypothetical protein